MPAQEALAQGPGALKRMSLHELLAVAEDIRQKIVTTCLTNGGHLGASLGVVDLAIALHYVFESPSEPLIWDVGHQAYAHKLLTGRWGRFSTLRQGSGISGFLSREESPHDVFGAGHSSTALSAALAMAYARSKSQLWSVAIVGDGGLTAGVALEALNNARGLERGPFLLVLNDNQMSISGTVGSLSHLFATGTARDFFELMGFEYVGPLDGHDLGVLIGTLQGIKTGPQNGRPVLLHVLTQKGKGYAPAEDSPSIYHGVSPVAAKAKDKAPAPTASTPQQTYSDAFGEALCELAEKDEKIVAITAAMPEGTGLTEFARRFPNRFFDVGIAEPHAVTFAAGLATQGLRPVVAIYSTFLQRAFDSLIHDVALQGLGVTVAIDRAGLVGADGPTHHGMFDLSYLGMIPGFTVSAPACIQDLRTELAHAVVSGKPWAIRYPRGAGPKEFATAGPVRWHQTAASPQLIVVGVGSAAMRVLTAARAVDPQGQAVTAVSITLIKPVAAELTEYAIAHPEAQILTVEDGVVRGGFGQSWFAGLGVRRRAMVALGYPDTFVPHGTQQSLDESLGLSASAIEQSLRAALGHEETN